MKIFCVCEKVEDGKSLFSMKQVFGKAPLGNPGGSRRERGVREGKVDF